MRFTLILLICLTYLGGYAQTIVSTSPNLDFKMGNFTNWVGYTWRYSTVVPSVNTSKVAGIVPRRHTIMTDTMAYDANTGYALRKIPSGYRYSARLGDEITSSDASPRCWEQSLRYTLKVDSTNALLVMKFACVLQYSNDHDADMEPRFKLTLYDQKGNLIPACANYDVYASNTATQGFKTYTPSGSKNPIQWRDWTTVGANLLDYKGQTITIEFMTCDCTSRFHFGYAYFVAHTQPLYITVKYCDGDESADLSAPVGFVTYDWKNTDGLSVDNSKTLHVTNPKEGETYTCSMTSATGCAVTLKSTIARYSITPAFTSSMIDCKSNTVQITDQSLSTHGYLSYLWNFEEGITSTDKNPKVTFKTSGIHPVTLTLSNPPSTCISVFKQDVESFSPPLVSIVGEKTYCPGLMTWLKGDGAYTYSWSTGQVADSIEVGSPGGSVWMVGHSSTGCVSDVANINISEEPDWTLAIDGDTGYCAGSNVLIKAIGASTYEWSTGSQKDTLRIFSPGNYTVYGTNARGCIKSLSTDITEYKIPDVDFSFSPAIINARYNEISLKIPDDDKVSYQWNLGDGTILSGSEVQHMYRVNYETKAYELSLSALSIYGCTDALTKIVDVVPFIPNVFSPNGDGVNDVFMPGLQVQVMDRNGLILYTGSDGWDGKYKGGTVDNDTYFYLVEYTDKDGRLQSLKGYITVVK